MPPYTHFDLTDAGYLLALSLLPFARRPILIPPQQYRTNGNPHYATLHNRPTKGRKRTKRPRLNSDNRKARR